MEEKIRSDLKKAQLLKDELTVSTLRLLLSEIHNAKIAKGSNLSDEDIIKVIQREVKKRKEAAEGFRSGGREDQAEKEDEEAKNLMKYLPEQLSNEELTKIVDEAINNLGARSISDMGRVMGAVMVHVRESADSGRVSSIVKERLLS